LAEIARTLQPLAAQHASLFESLSAHRGIMFAVQAPLREYAGVFARIARRTELADACIASGFLPFNAIVEHLESLDVEDIKSVTSDEKFKDEIWPLVKLQILDELQKYGNSPRSARIMKQAIEAFDRGLFEIITASIFAQIESRARELKNRTGANVHFRAWLVDAIGELQPWQTGGVEHLEMYKYLDDGAYRDVRSFEEAQKVIWPNRHAHVHGWVENIRDVDALNVIVFGHFVFFAMGVIESNMLDESDVGHKTN
jgi:hypothetical protein